jgi:hypothetical protein
LAQREFVIKLVGRGIRLMQAMPLDRFRRFAQRFTALLDQPIPQARERLVMPSPALWDLRRKLLARAPLRVLFLRRAIGMGSRRMRS